MNFFDREEFVKEMRREFEIIDDARKVFTDNLCGDIFALIRHSFSGEILTEELKAAIEDKATEVFLSTQSVIDKDRTFPEYRMIFELDRMRKAVNRRVEESITPEFDSKLLHFVKYHIVEHFSEVYNLSAEGFLLLDLYAKYHFQDLRQVNRS